MDLNHYFAQDVSVSATGDLATVDGVTESQQRILRRLLTVPGTYIFHPGYGAGLPRYVGAAMGAQQIREVTALIKNQTAQEASVDASQPITVSVQPFLGGVSYQVQYTLAGTNVTVPLSFTYHEA